MQIFKITHINVAAMGRLHNMAATTIIFFLKTDFFLLG